MTRFAPPFLVLLLSLIAGGSPGIAPDAVAASPIEEGKRIAFDRRRGNCMSCHLMPGATDAGNIGPPLLGMKARFPDKAKLHEQIRDATKLNPQSVMPPFGKHEILTAEEVDKVVEYVHSL